MNTFETYSELVKPTWAPPSWIFGPVWSFLYLLIAISFGDCVLQTCNEANPVHGCIAIYLEHHFQCNIHILSIWIEEQHTRCNRHTAGARDFDLGNDCSISICSMDYLYPDSIFALGFICDSSTTHYHISQQIKL
jgi:hypothetical protein